VRQASDRTREHVDGDEGRYADDQLGDDDPLLMLRACAQATERRERLAKPFDQAIEWAGHECAQLTCVGAVG
jgi:hypothetical protein